MNIILFNDVDTDKVAAVEKEMKELGAPTIKAFWVGAYDAWVALNGSHRIVAAHNLGLTPIIDEIEYNDETTTEELGMSEEFQGDIWTMDEILTAAARRPVIVTFKE